MSPVTFLGEIFSVFFIKIKSSGITEQLRALVALTDQEILKQKPLEYYSFLSKRTR